MGFVRDITGKTAANAAKEAGEIQALGAEEAGRLFDPLSFGGGASNQSQIDSLTQQIEQMQSSQGGGRGAFGRVAGNIISSQLPDLMAQRDALIAQDANRTPGLGGQGIAQAGFLTDPQAQYDFLQSNPMFQAALDNANRQTMGSAAAQGRLSSGDTLQQLSQNTLLASQPLIQDQKASILDLIGYGERAAAAQGNLRTGQAAATAGGLVGAANARGQGAQGLLGIGAGLAAAGIGAGMFGGTPPPGIGGHVAAGSGFRSDPQLKMNKVKVGKENGFNIYTWDWNEKGNKLGLFGSDRGVMADEVKEIMPEAVYLDGDYLTVNYDMIGVKH